MSAVLDSRQALLPGRFGFLMGLYAENYHRLVRLFTPRFAFVPADAINSFNRSPRLLLQTQLIPTGISRSSKSKPNAMHRSAELWIFRLS